MKLKTILLLNIFFFLILSCINEDNTDINEQIFIKSSDFTVDINEFPNNDQILGIIQASTNKGNITFSIISQTPNDAFTVNSLTGELKVLNKANYDFDINPEISGVVEIRNGDITSDSNITINVKNVEKIFNGFVNINSQTQLEAFSRNNYDRINGAVMLLGETIVNTGGLNSIKFIDGDLIILGTNLETIEGFANANLSTDKTVQIVNNQKLKNINGLQSVTNRLLNLDISNNPLINDLDGIKNISNVSNEINISDTEFLTNLNGLSGINNPVKFLFIRNNTAIVDTEGLSNIPKITSFSFTDNDSTISLSNMSSLTEVDNFFLDGNDLLENINGLFELETCLELTIQNNISLKNLDGLVKLNKVDDGAMRITGNTSLRDFCGLSLVSTISTVGYNIRDNFYNPTKDEIKNGNCSI